MLFKKKKKSESDLKKKQSKTDKKVKKKTAKKEKSKKEKNVPNRVSEKEHVFRDVRYFRYMPYSLLIALVLLIGGVGWMAYNNHQYSVEQSRLSMPKGTQLPLFKGTAKGQAQLTIGDSIISPDKKHMAISIQYNADAHKNMSAFGNQYHLWLVTDKGYPVKNIHMKYGFFGTDGNGVLQISSDKPFRNQAIVVMLIDESNLVTEDELNDSSSPVADNNIDKSITAQLAEGNMNNDNQDNNAATSSSQKSSGPPIYYMRLNPYSAKKVNQGWENERELCDLLFVNSNLKKLKKQMNSVRSQLKATEKTLEECNKRLEVNPQDQYATEKKQSMEDSINSLQNTYDQDLKQYEKDKSYRISKHILGDEADSFRVIETNNMSYFGNSGSGNSGGN